MVIWKAFKSFLRNWKIIKLRCSLLNLVKQIYEHSIASCNINNSNLPNLFIRFCFFSRHCPLELVHHRFNFVTRWFEYLVRHFLERWWLQRATLRHFWLSIENTKELVLYFCCNTRVPYGPGYGNLIVKRRVKEKLNNL